MAGPKGAPHPQSATHVRQAMRLQDSLSLQRGGVRDPEMIAEMGRRGIPHTSLSNMGFLLAAQQIREGRAPVGVPYGMAPTGIPQPVIGQPGAVAQPKVGVPQTLQAQSAEIVLRRIHAKTGGAAPPSAMVGDPVQRANSAVMAVGFAAALGEQVRTQFEFRRATNQINTPPRRPDTHEFALGA